MLRYPAGSCYARPMTNTNSLHAHVDTAARDCDGPVYRDWVETMTDGERASDFPDLDFKARILSNHVSFSPADKVTVTVREDGFVMEEATEEGFRSAEVRWCEDEDCDPDKRGQRDVYAELMGY